MRNIYPTEPCQNIIDPVGDTNDNQRASNRRPSEPDNLRADSKVQVRRPLLNLIRSVQLEIHHTQATEETEFTVLEIHASYATYIQNYISNLPLEVRNRRVIPCDHILRNISISGYGCILPELFLFVGYVENVT